MRNKTLFAKLVRYTCWIGDLLLVCLAMILAAKNRDALDPLMMLTISLCILGGAFLPLLVYYIDFLFAQNEVRAEEQHAPESLRQSVNRLSELTQRVEVAIADVTKATLIARQVPDRIEEKTAFLEDVSNRMQPGMLDSMLATLSSMETRLYSLHADWEGLQRKLDQAESEASLEMASETILRRLTEIEKQFNQKLTEDMWSPLADWSESFGSELASIRELIKSSEGREGTSVPRTKVVEQEAAVPPLPEPVVPEVKATVEAIAEASSPEVEETVAVVDEEDSEGELDELESDWVDETDLSEEEKDKALSFLEEAPDLGEEKIPEEEPKEAIAVSDQPEVAEQEAVIPDEAAVLPEEKEEPARSETKDPEAQQALFFEDIDLGPSIDRTAIVIQAKVLVGVANRVFIRGEGAGLSWDEGTPLELIGIGEWRWAAEEVEEPVHCQLWLNDERPAKGEAMVLSPGKIHLLKPVF